MAKNGAGSKPTAWVPSGLKVRGAVTAVTATSATPSQQHAMCPTVPVPLPASSPVPVSPPVAVPELEPVLLQRREVDVTSHPPPADMSRRRTDDPPDAQPALQKSQSPVKPGFRPMPILTLLSLICLGILLSLGQWQWNKYVLKSKAPADIASIEPSSVSAALEAPNPEYLPVIVDGLIDPRTIKISVVQQGMRGYRLFSPVVLEAGGIFVDRGFVSEDDIQRATPPSGQVHLTGVLRKGAKANRYTPDNDPSSDVWYWPDLTAMADMLVIQTNSAQYYVALTQVDPLGTGQPIINPYSDKGGANQVSAGTHLGYALQWWGFGLALIGVYIGLHVRAGRLRIRRVVPS